jgi:type I restriction enzyme R subunit
VPQRKEDEWTTRRERVEKALRHAGWTNIVDFVKGKKYDNAAVREYETVEGPADYVLFHNREAIAAIEAKKVTLGPQNVLSQALRYARGFRGGKFTFGEFHLPFAYSTNGEIFWFQDLRDPSSRSRQIERFHTPFALEEFLSTDRARSTRWLKQNPNDNQFLRPYQREAIDAVEQALRTNRRKMLLAMATGTGKTFVAISLIYRLLKSELARRILFLVDRRALAAQAVGAFSSFEPEPGLKFDRIYEVYSQRFRREDMPEEFKFDPNVLPTEYLTNPKPQHTFVYVCTIQRMRINLFGREDMFAEIPSESEVEEDAEKIDIPIHAFDVVIADECHRGYTSTEEGKWRQVLDHFDAVKIGLTATPAAHTTSYFRDIIYRYEYERAVREGYLVDYDAVAINSGITMKGLFLKEGEEVGLVDTQTGKQAIDVLEDERAYDTVDLEQKVTAPDRNMKIVKEFAKHALEQDNEFGHFPKTIFFAVNDLPHVSHADQLVDILRDEFGKGDVFVQKITGSPTVDRPLQEIRKFRNRPVPAIAVTVDMLTTGVDIPKCENLVFLRPVKSRILFAQMLGRGTRRCEEINKTHFTVFDCFDGTLLEYFRNTTDFTAEPPIKPTRSIQDIVNAIYNNQDRDYNVRALVKRLRRIEKNISAEGREQFSQFIPEADIGAFAESLPTMINRDWAGVMKILRSPKFQDLMENYPRAPRTFVVAYNAEDTVTSDYIFRTNDGRELKPQDYLLAFERFVRENPDHIEALNILLSKPSGFHTKELTELRKKLESRPERYTESNLRRAYHNELADIISIIRHAATGEELLSAEQRVDRAMSKVKEGRRFTPEQEQWLQYIRDHLVRNLVVDEPDFKFIPFSRHGGWEKANLVFDGKLAPLLETINVAMVTA